MIKIENTENIINNRYYVILLCFILVLVTHFLLPISLESYEKYFSALVSGTYTDYAIYDYDTDVHFLIFSLYSLLNKAIPNVQIYSYIIILYNIISLVFFGVVLHHLLSNKISNRIYFLVVFLLLFLSISTYQIVNLSSTRIVLLLCSCMYYLIYLGLFNTVKKNIALFFIFLSLSLIRIDATVIATIIFTLVFVFIKKLNLTCFIPFIVSVFMFIGFNVMMDTSEREAKKVYYHRELDLLDRHNIDYKNISKEDSLYISLLTNHFIFDTNHFKMDYVNKILKTKSNGFINSFKNINLYFNTLLYSLEDIFFAKWLILINLFLIIFTLIQFNFALRIKMLMVMLFLFPYSMCFYIALPLRFIEPFYLLYSTFLVILLVKKNKYILSVTTIILCVLASLNIKKSLQLYKVVQCDFSKNYSYLQLNFNKSKPIVIENIIIGNFFPSDPLQNIKNINTLFLNFGFFNTYECYDNAWKKYCNCNSLSLIDKLSYISRNNLEFVTTKERTEVYKKYLKEYWKRNIDFTNFKQINGDIYSCKILFD